MSFRKACVRTLDRPIVIFGLEPEELVAVGLISGAILFIIDAIPAVLTGAVLWVGLSRLKAGKPPGYLYELYYGSGLMRWGPGFLKTPHLLPARVRVLDAFPRGDDDRDVRDYWFDRPRLDC
jgi:hypothetical protein